GRGRMPEAVAAFRKAVAINSQNLLATFRLAEEVERQGDDAEFQRLMQKILTTQPENLAVLLELARIAAKRGDTNTLHQTVDKITEHSSTWPSEAKQQLSELKAAAAGPDSRAAATRVAFLRNVLVRVPEFRDDLGIIKPPPGEEAR